MALTLSDHAALANSLFSFLNIFFNWKIIALQCCVGFCHTTRIRRKDTHVPFSWTSLPVSSPSHPSGSSQSTQLSSQGQMATLHLLAVVHILCQCVYSIHAPSPSPTVSASPFSASASPFLPCKRVHQHHRSRFHMRVNMWYLFFSFWLALLYITGSRFIHLSSADSRLFLFMAVTRSFLWSLILHLGKGGPDQLHEPSVVQSFEMHKSTGVQIVPDPKGPSRPLNPFNTHFPTLGLAVEYSWSIRVEHGWGLSKCPVQYWTLGHTWSIVLFTWLFTCKAFIPNFEALFLTLRPLFLTLRLRGVKQFPQAPHWIWGRGGLFLKPIWSQPLPDFGNWVYHLI